MTEHLQWEYRVHSVGSLFKNPKDADLEVMLDEWGEEGWEIISAIPEANSYRVRLIAKRPLTLTSRRRRSWPEAN